MYRNIVTNSTVFDRSRVNIPDKAVFNSNALFLFVHKSTGAIYQENVTSDKYQALSSRETSVNYQNY